MNLARLGPQLRHRVIVVENWRQHGFCNEIVCVVVALDIQSKFPHDPQTRTCLRPHERRDTDSFGDSSRRPRRRRSAKRGGRRDHRDRQEIASCQLATPPCAGDLLDLDEALGRLSWEDPPSAEIVKLRSFAGLTVKQAAEVMGSSPRHADFLWAYARAWLRRELDED